MSSVNLGAFFNVCDPFGPPPREENGRSAYVNFGQARLPTDPVAAISTQIEWDSERSKFLFAGHLGSGKTTELKRLQRRLESGTETARRYSVLYIDGERYLDLADVELTDILLMLAAGLGEAFGRESPYKFGLEYSVGFQDTVKKLWNRLGAFTQMEPEKVEFSAGFLKLAVGLRQSPSSRQAVRRAFERRETFLIDEINRLFQEIGERLEGKYGTALVIIVDSLEKIHLRPESDSPFTNHQRIFVNGAPVLRSLECSMVFSIPISLAYSSDRARLENDFGTTVVTLPMVKALDREGKECDEGLKRLREVIEARAVFAEATVEELFESPDEIIKTLCLFSGGHVRGLMRLLRAACTFVETAPITGEAVQFARQQAANAFGTSIREEDFPRLVDVYRSKTIENSSQFQRLLYDLCIFEYMNGGEPWYDVNPAVAFLDKFKKARGD